jgi:integrase
MKGTLNFSIRQLKSGKASIQVIHSFGRGNEVRYSTGLYIDSAKHWNYEKQRVKNVIAQSNASNINKFLNLKVVKISKALEDLYFEKPNYDRKEVKKIFDLIFGKSKAVSNSTPNLVECYKWYIKYYTTNPNPYTKRPLSNGTIRSFKTSLKKFEIYSKKKGGVDYEDITMELYEDFIEHLRAQDYSNNYISNHIKNLKTILNYSFSRGYHTNTVHKRREFAKPNESVDAIYLNAEELKQLERLQLPTGQEISRDLFLIGAYTGLRVSDFNRLSKENLDYLGGKYYFKIETKKTSQPLLIPCHPVTLKIIEKYNFAPPPKKPDQHINRDLKIIGKQAKLNEEIEITKTIGGKRKTKTYKKHQLLTTHTARRSFCTNAYKAGMPTLDIMTISGHQTERVFYEYIKASSLERAKRIAEHPFFSD